MARYRLNAEIANGIAPLCKLSPASCLALVQEIDQKLKVKLAIEDDVESLLRASEVGSKDPQSVEKLAAAFAGLHLLRLSAPKTVDEMTDDIVDSVQDNGVAEVELESLRQNVRAILGSRVLHASMKAWTLVDDHETIYLTSRIITDLRPVFDDDLSQPLKASLLTHTLKLVVRTDNRQKNLYVVADNADLKELRDHIDRALAKGASLKTTIRNHPNHLFGASLSGDVEDE